MKSEMCNTRPIKRISKTCACLIMKKIWIEKIAKLLSHSIYNIGVLHTSDRHTQTISITNLCVLKRPDVVTFDESKIYLRQINKLIIC